MLNTSLIYCLHRLSLIELCLISLKSDKKSVIIYFGELSFSLKIISSLFLKDKSILVKKISSILGLNICSVGDSENNSDYSNIQFNTMEQTSKIVDELVSYYEKNSKFNWLSNLLGKRPSKAFLSKNFSYHIIYPELLTINLCKSQNKNLSKLIVISDFFSSEVHEKFFIKKFNDLKIRKKLINISDQIQSFSININLIISFLKLIFLRGIKFKIFKKIKFNYAFEFIDPKNFDNAYTKDFLIKKFSLGKSDYCFYLTNRQKKYLKNIDHNILSEIKLKSKKHNLIELDSLSYSYIDFCLLVWKLISLLFILFFSNQKIIWSKILSNAFIDYIDFYVLFKYHKINNLIYLTFPNGRSSLRFNDSIVAGLSQKFGSKIIGIQTRTIYTTKYEDCFDCFDLYFSWGTEWNNISKLRTKYNKSIKNLGCIYSDLLSDFNVENPQKLKNNLSKSKELLILVFDADISKTSHYTWEYSKNFILNILKLAGMNSNCYFLFKSKDISNIKKYEQEFEIVNNIKLVNNFEFSNNQRNDYKTMINLCDIVISIGYTTPGFEALTIGKRSIYYSELINAGKAFNILPNLVANNFDELYYLFNLAKDDYLDYVVKNKQKLYQLDYRK